MTAQINPLQLPDEALVIRGGENHPESFANGSGVMIDASGIVSGVSVNVATGLTVGQLTTGDPITGYPGIPHNQIGVTTVGAIRAAGGNVVPTPRKSNPNHATLSGINCEEASRLFRPTRPNPNRRPRK